MADDDESTNGGSRRRFTVHKRDELTQADYMMARYKLASSNCFMSTDDVYDVSLGSTGSWNKYTYVMNNPIYYIDPSGHRTKENMINGEELLGGQSNTGSHGSGAGLPIPKKVWEIFFGESVHVIAAKPVVDKIAIVTVSALTGYAALPSYGSMVAADPKDIVWNCKNKYARNEHDSFIQAEGQRFRNIIDRLHQSHRRPGEYTEFLKYQNNRPIVLDFKTTWGSNQAPYVPPSRGNPTIGVNTHDWVGEATQDFWHFSLGDAQAFARIFRNHPNMVHYMFTDAGIIKWEPPPSSANPDPNKPRKLFRKGTKTCYYW